MRRYSVPLLALLIFVARPASALTDEEIFRDFRFNLVNPGARALGVGGAFLSLADDATAAQANPAGLGFLQRSEYFGEVRLVDNGAQSSILEESLPAGIDTFVATGTDLDDTVSPSFVSAVTTYGRWAMGLSRQELLNIKNSTASIFQFTFPETPGAFIAEGLGAIDVKVTNINVSVGARITDYLGVGGTLTYSMLDVKSEVTNWIVDTNGNIAGEPILEQTLDLRTSINDDTYDVTFSLGAIYKKPNKWSVGAVYRRAPRFDVIERIDPVEGLDLFGVRDRLGTAFINRFSLPDAYAVGGSWFVFERLMLALDIERILYSNLMNGYTAGVNVLTGEDAEFTVDDATDFRLGAEYVLFNENNPLPPMAVRAGVFTESDSTIRAISTGTESFATEEVFSGRDDQVHGALGVGVFFKRFTVDFGVDISDTDNEYLLSVIYRSKK